MAGWLRLNRKIQGPKSAVDLFGFVSDAYPGWDIYVKQMGKDGEWGDEITLRAMSQILGIRINVVSANENSDTTATNPVTLYSTTAPWSGNVTCDIWLSNYGDSHYEWLSINKK